MLEKLFIKFIPNGSSYSPRRAKMFSYIFILIFFSIFYSILLAVKDTTNSEKIAVIKYVGFIIFIGLVYGEIVDYFGKKRHQNILYTKKISSLKAIYNFEIENLNHRNYWGYKGVFKDYFFRVYYDWSTGFKKKGSRFCFMLHYKPLMISENFVDGERMNSLTEKYNKGNTYNYEVKFNTSYLIIYMRYNFLTSFDEFKRKLDLAVKMAKEENLEPNSEREVENLLLDKKLQILHAPEIDTFHE